MNEEDDFFTAKDKKYKKDDFFSGKDKKDDCILEFAWLAVSSFELIILVRVLLPWRFLLTGMYVLTRLDSQQFESETLFAQIYLKPFSYSISFHKK